MNSIDPDQRPRSVASDLVYTVVNVTQGTKGSTMFANGTLDINGSTMFASARQGCINGSSMFANGTLGINGLNFNCYVSGTGFGQVSFAPTDTNGQTFTFATQGKRKRK